MSIDVAPAVSIIVPVLNESDIIEGTVMHLTGMCRGLSAEIIIVDGDPSGSTIRRVKSKQIRTITAFRGRAKQMNAGAEAGRAGVLVFVHADTLLPPGALQDILDACRRPEIAAGAFYLGINSGKKIFRVIETLANIRCRLTRIPYGDQAVFFKKKTFMHLGGYAGIPVMEDIEIMQRVKQKKLKTALLKKNVKTSARRWQKEGIFYALVRNNLLACFFYAGTSPRALERFYNLHNPHSTR